MRVLPLSKLSCPCRQAQLCISLSFFPLSEHGQHLPHRMSQNLHALWQRIFPNMQPLHPLRPLQSIRQQCSFCIHCTHCINRNAELQSLSAQLFNHGKEERHPYLVMQEEMSPLYLYWRALSTSGRQDSNGQPSITPGQVCKSHVCCLTVSHTPSSCAPHTPAQHLGYPQASHLSCQCHSGSNS
mmetsp:Transcript_14206/g.38524  ORF Transcript_14206/g.38524 Transcript_14206/m.38524 type:complete len:184 (-) Transcript_14206:1108-1659(-)